MIDKTATTVFNPDITDSLSSEQSRQTVRVQLGADGLLQGGQHGKHCARTNTYQVFKSFAVLSTVVLFFFFCSLFLLEFNQIVLSNSCIHGLIVDGLHLYRTIHILKKDRCLYIHF